MTEESLKDLVLQHDASIQKFAQSIEHLAKAQSETSAEIKELGKRLEEITTYLAKQQVFSNKLDTMDRELVESFKRVHDRIDDIKQVQLSERGCQSVKLLDRDIKNCEKDVVALQKTNQKLEKKVEELTIRIDKLPQPQTLKWALSLLIMYAISFGTFVIDSVYKERSFEERQMLINKDITKELVKLNRNINVTVWREQKK